jgi:type I restriction enzyme S subunit
MSKQAKKRLVPKLRFPEFRDAEDWVERPVGSVCEVLNNQRKPVTSTARVVGEYPYYGASGIVDYIDDFIFDERLVLVGEDGAKWGAFEPTAFIAEGKYWVNNHAHVLRPVEVSDTLLASYLTMLDLQKYVTGAAPPKLTLGKLKEIPVLFPKEPDEQQKIAACLSSVDVLLAAEREKLEALRAHKKGLMQQIFPAEGNTVPELRFPGFKRKWSAEPLGKFTTKVGSGITPRGGDKTYLKEGRIFVRSQNVGWGLLLLDEVAYIDEETHQTFPGTEIQLNDVLLNLSGASIGRCAVADERLVGGNVNQHVCIIRVDEELHPVYLEQFILSNTGQRQIDSFQAGGNRQGLNYDQVRSFSIPMPADVDEQKGIAACLSSLDKRIVLQDERVEILEEYKKGLMQGLFPG